MSSFGFIITRHVNSCVTNKYWNKSVKLLRTFYPNCKIVIIDDNSNQQFVNAEHDYTNVQIIQSEFPGRGELLPYYYYIKNKFFDNAVILHDSVFIHKRVNFEKLIGIRVMPIWHFVQDNENLNNTLRIATNLKNSFNVTSQLALNDTYITLMGEKWTGCFGVQSYINREFLLRLETKYKLTNLVNVVKNRSDRCCLERILGVIFSTEKERKFKSRSLLGDIRDTPMWEYYTYEKYEKDCRNNMLRKYVVKVWTGR